MKKISLVSLAFCCFAFLTDASAAVLLTTFGSTTSPTFLKDSSTSFATVQSGSSIQISGLDNGSLLAGSFASANITGQTTKLTLTGSTTAAPASGFNVLLFDSNFNKATYTGGTWSGLSGGSTSLSFLSKDASFNFATVSGVELDTGGVGNNISATLTGLTAGVVPEPSRMMLSFLGFGMIVFRRRRNS